MNHLLSEIREANSFLSRVFGLMFQSEKNIKPLYFANCKAVHTSFMRVPLDLVWVDAAGKVLEIDHSVPAFKIRYCRNAFGVVEFLGDTFSGSIGDYLELKFSDSREMSNNSGQALVETAIILPILFLIIFGFFQIGLAFSAKQKLLYVTNYAAQVGSLTNDDGKVFGAIEEFYDVNEVSASVEGFYQNTTNSVSVADRKYGDTLTVSLQKTNPITVPFFSVSIIPLEAKSSAKVLCTNNVAPYVCE